MLQDFQNFTFQSIDLGTTLTALGVAFGCGLFISVLYQQTYRGASYSPTFVRSMIFLAMITAVIMLAIGNNLARAFGLVGAMSIIRFRTAVKDPQDIVFVFFTLAVGLAAGVGMYVVAVTGTLSVGAVVALTAGTDFGVRHRRALLLQLVYEAGPDEAEAAYLPVLRAHCRRHELINARSGGGDRLDLTFFVRLRDRDELPTLTRALAAAPGVRDVNLFYDEEEP